MDSVESDPELIRKNPANQEVLKMEEIRKLRSIRELEVAGSNPVAPTISPKESSKMLFFFNSHFFLGYILMIKAILEPNQKRFSN